MTWTLALLSIGILYKVCCVTRRQTSPLLKSIEKLAKRERIAP